MQKVAQMVVGPLSLALIVGMSACCNCHRDQRGGGITSAGAADAASAAVIQDAYYTNQGTNDPNLRDWVVVSGERFKAGDVTVEDCQTRLPDHPVPSQRAWKDCEEIDRASGILYSVRVEHGAMFDKVEIKVRGADGGWSDPFEIRK